MKPRQQKIIRERRQYNQWVASQTLEDYALRFTAQSARKSTARVGNTALGPIAFLACEAIGGTLTMLYGFPNVAWAIGAFAVLMFLIGLPIAYYAARYGVDIDLLTRGAGFGYMGSTVTSLIYASFTFLLFAIEASIMSVALNLVFDIPMWLAHICSSLVVIPIALYGISLISKMQIVTQPIWLILQFIPIAIIAWKHPQEIAAWTHYGGTADNGGTFNFVLFGLAGLGVAVPAAANRRTGGLPAVPAESHQQNRIGWWTAVIGTGPGWVLLGGFKLLVGRSSPCGRCARACTSRRPTSPPSCITSHFARSFQSPTFALVLTGIFVIVCQLKINVTNAYAGSIAWSNFFSRSRTRTRAAWCGWCSTCCWRCCSWRIGIFRAIESILVIYANFAAGWIGALTADLVINKPLGFSPKYIEFKRAHLYDINPSGLARLVISVLLSSLAFMGAFGEYAQILSPFVALTVAFIAAPLIAWGTRGKYYLARPPMDCRKRPPSSSAASAKTCSSAATSPCARPTPVPICSLCCTLEARCRDQCKTGSRFNEQLDAFITHVLPKRVGAMLNTRAGHFGGLLLLSNLAIGLLLGLIYQQYAGSVPAERETIRTTLWLVYFALLVVSGVMSWLIVLAHESRRAAEAESARQTGHAHGRNRRAQTHRRRAAESQGGRGERQRRQDPLHRRHQPRDPHAAQFHLRATRSCSSAAPRARRTMRSASFAAAPSTSPISSTASSTSPRSRMESCASTATRCRSRNSSTRSSTCSGCRRRQGHRVRLSAARPTCPRTCTSIRSACARSSSTCSRMPSSTPERGNATLSVRYRSQVAEFEVSDTGVGIPANELERVFEPFERGQGANVRAIPGTGLGLTITKLLTQIMGGEINATSVEGVGTTFTVRLLLSEATPANPERNAAQGTRTIASYAGPRRKLLLIDDDPSHIDIVRALLAPLDFTLHTASDGATGLALAEQHRPDLAMVDISMPGITGWEVAERLRAMPGLEKLKVVIVSANAHEFTPGGTGATHDAFLIKPIDMQRMLECLAAQLNLDWVYDGASTAGSGARDRSAGRSARALASPRR
jgi:CheY-like chemotaxis protein/purine-cytosine permease-like protein